MRERLAADLAKPDWTLTVAETAGTVIGMLATHPGKLDQIFLDPDWKGRGVGKALFAEAKRLMPGGFTLWTQEANARARAFYERRGMVHESTGPHPEKPERIVAHYRWSPD
ncbi:MAG: GNAT family N-acetyltransferase [Sphingomonas sp.]|uniref:GNAT family N-acetyltransferase n=1 Tax=Sphingomonas sp. TaxID=28214 RepID=UPI001214B971|nr:GNAT family N-acetyltransferase [Sphingomonas sp.]THD36983.1 MAG: GNAT family N-acetyltransferase [Sphingomonas sp.]